MMPLKKGLVINLTDALPWYKEGLRFKCTECGKCCTGAPGYVWITEQEMQGMADALNISVTDFKRKYTRMRDNRYSLIERKVNANEYACIFLKDKQCQLYLHRPIQCRTFPWWAENLTSEASWKRAAEDCEGINDEAPLHPYEQIIQMVRKKEGEK